MEEFFSEAARRIAASGIPILSRTQTEPSISRALSLEHQQIHLDRVPSRTIRPSAPARSSTPRVPIHQLPRIRRRPDAAPAAAAPRTTTASTRTVQRTNTAPAATPSFIDHLLTSQERLHNLQNVRMHG